MPSQFCEIDQKFIQTVNKSRPLKIFLLLNIDSISKVLRIKSYLSIILNNFTMKNLFIWTVTLILCKKQLLFMVLFFQKIDKNYIIPFKTYIWLSFLNERSQKHRNHISNFLSLYRDHQDLKHCLWVALMRWLQDSRTDFWVLFKLAYVAASRKEVLEPNGQNI